MANEQMGMPAASPSPEEMAVFDQMRQSISPKEFSDEMLMGASQVDPQAVAEFKKELDALDVPEEVLDALNDLVDEVLAKPEQYEELRQNYISMGLPEDFLPEQFDPQFFAALNMAIDQMVGAPAGEQAFAKGGIAELKPIAKAIASYGRNGDTMLAHITPAEARMLKRRGGSGTINPDTGLPEFSWLSKGLKSIGKAVSGAVKSIGNAVKKFANSTVGRLVSTIALGFFLGPAAASMLGVTSAAGVAAVSGFVGSAGSTLLGGGDLRDALKAGAIGGLTAGAGAGIMGGSGAFQAGSYTGPTTVGGQWDKLKSAFTPGPLQQAATSATQAAPGAMPTAPGATPLAEATAPVAPPSGDPLGDFIQQNEAARAAANAPAIVPDAAPFEGPLAKATAPVAPPATAATYKAPKIGESFSKIGEGLGLGEAPASWETTKEGLGKLFAPGGPSTEQLNARATELVTANPKLPFDTALKQAAAEGPGMLRTYGPATLAGIGALGLSGGFQPKPATVTPEAQYMRDLIARDRKMLEENPGMFTPKGFEPFGAVYNDKGQVVEWKPWTTEGARTAQLAAATPRRFADGGDVNPFSGETTGAASVLPAYFQANQDVAQAYAQNAMGMTPEQFAQTHFEKYGQAEGRTAPGGIASLAPVAQAAPAAAVSPVSQFMSGMAQNTPTYTQLQSTLASKPQISQAIESIYALDPKHSLFTGSGGNLQPVINNLASEMDRIGADAALKNFYKQQQNLVGFGGENWFGGQNMGNQDWAKLQREQMSYTPIVEKDEDWRAMAQRTSGRDSTTATIWRDPNSKLGIGVIRDENGVPNRIGYYDRDGRMLRTSIFTPSEVYRNAEEFGIDLSGAGELNNMLRQAGVSTAPGSIYKGSDIGVDFANIARGEGLEAMASPEWLASQIAHNNWQNQYARDAGFTIPDSVVASAQAKIVQQHEMAKRLVAGGVQTNPNRSGATYPPVTGGPVAPPATGAPGGGAPGGGVPPVTTPPVEAPRDGTTMPQEPPRGGFGEPTTTRVNPAIPSWVAPQTTTPWNTGKLFTDYSQSMEGTNVTPTKSALGAQVVGMNDPFAAGRIDPLQYLRYAPGNATEQYPGTFTLAPAGQTAGLTPLDLSQYVVEQPYNTAQNYQSLNPVNRAQGGIAALGSGGYPRRTGKIDGPGTETSDSIPAMLSDGEFVMTAKAVRGAGNGSRREGAKKMYALMHRLEKNAARG